MTMEIMMKMVMLMWMVISKKPPNRVGARCQEAELLLKLDPQDVVMLTAHTWGPLDKQIKCGRHF